MPALYCIWALLLFLAAPAAAQQAAPAPHPETFVVFLRGSPVGREEVTVHTDAAGTTVTSKARLLPPVDIVTRRAEVKYSPDWTPESLVYDFTTGGIEVLLRAAFKDGTGTWEGTEAGKPVSATTRLSPDTFLLPSMFIGAYEAVARRLVSAAVGAEFHAVSAPSVDVPFRIANIAPDRMQLGTSMLSVRRYELKFDTAVGELTANVTVDESGRFLRLYVPAQALDVVRDDLASAASRTQLYTNPGDEAVLIPGAGFNIGATLTRPSAPASGPARPARLPAVVLIAGAGAADRDGYDAGVPILGQLAGALADAGFLALRYDKRGYGQSGGRAESATLSDFAEDARGVVKWLSERKDIDPKRIALVGHADGAWVALLAASREKRIAAAISISGPSTTGEQLVLEQQGRALDAMNASQTERDAKIALQKKIQAAVLTGSGWADVPPELRRQADTPWFHSLLTFDPAKVLKDVRQPLLLVHGELDRQVPIAHIERLADLARKGSKSKSVEVVSVRGVNHLLVPAITGDITEQPTLTDRNVSKDVTTAVSSWLTKTFGALK